MELLPVEKQQFQKKIDFVLVYEEKPDKRDKTAKSVTVARRRREVFEDNLRREGLTLHYSHREFKTGRCCFVLIHAPWEFLTRQAEFLKLKMPIKVNDLVSQGSIAKSFWSKVLRKLADFLRWERALEQPQYFNAVFSRERCHQFIVEDKDTFFSNCQRCRMVCDILSRVRFEEAGGYSGINALLENGAYSDAYPLHEGNFQRELGVPPTDRQILYRRWANLRRFYEPQPHDLIRKYFGEKIALYFAWIGYYTIALIPAAFLGFVCIIFGAVTLSSDVPSEEVCYGETGQIIMCPSCNVGCDFWQLSSVCVYSKATHLFDNFVTVLFAIFMSLWAALFLEGWKRRQTELAWKWDLLDFELEEDIIRPEFLRSAKKLALNPITQEMEPYLPVPERFFRLFTSMVTVLFFLCLVIAFAVGIIVYRVMMINQFDKHESALVRVYAGLAATAVSALLNLIVIMLLERVYQKLAWYLTNWEYPRTQAEFDNSFTFKVFMFQFINYYSSLFYIAFFKGRFAPLPGSRGTTTMFGFGYKPEMCDMRGCMVELLIQLSMIMVGKQFINNFFEIGIPIITKKFRKIRQSRQYSCRHRWEFDFYLNPLPPTYLIDEYLEMALQFGFITLFVAAFPLAPFFALLNNILEIRIDAFKYIGTYRRPTPARVKDLGIWNNILETLSNLAVLTNACVIAFTSDFVPRMLYYFTSDQPEPLHGYVNSTLSYFDAAEFCNSTSHSVACEVGYCRYPDYRNPPCGLNITTTDGTCDDEYGITLKWWHVLAARLAFIIVFEHVVFSIKFLVQYFVPEMPFRVFVQQQREKLLAKQALYDFELEKAHRRRNKQQPEPDA